MNKLTLLLSILACAACGSTTQTTTDAPTMIQRGAALYGEECAHCHGDGGQGTDRGPRVVGEGALPYAPRADSQRDINFRTALDVFTWVKRTMPGEDPGSLTDEEYLAIMAFALDANGVKLSAPLDAATAEAIVLHASP
ncbi:MAG: cytochrome c [Deltaproteobacteria bacterium]|jgi:cytochrome c